MKIIVPDYYSEFKCIADRCKHNCCIGWEIDIDEDSVCRYNEVEGDFGSVLRQSIEGNPPHFKTVGKEDRCPHLNSQGLCDIIINLGEDALCQICADHPRFRNFYSDRVEMGLGLCCEEAARIIVSREEKTELVGSEEGFLPDEASFFKLRQKIFDIIQDRENDIWSRLERLLDIFGITMDGCLSIFDELEYMEDELLSEIHNSSKELPERFDTCFEQLAVYFIYRHLADGMSMGDIPERVGFAVLSVRVIGMLANDRIKKGESPLRAIADVSRMYSAEIEYSEENTESIIDFFS